jgi:hypothetical protein
VGVNELLSLAVDGAPVILGLAGVSYLVWSFLQLRREDIKILLAVLLAMVGTFFLAAFFGVIVRALS